VDSEYFDTESLCCWLLQCSRCTVFCRHGKCILSHDSGRVFGERSAKNCVAKPAFSAFSAGGEQFYLHSNLSMRPLCPPRASQPSLILVNHRPCQLRYCILPLTNPLEKPSVSPCTPYDPYNNLLQIHISSHASIFPIYPQANSQTNIHFTSFTLTDWLAAVLTRQAHSLARPRLATAPTTL
jgi:hypothetical protein